MWSFFSSHLIYISIATRLTLYDRCVYPSSSSITSIFVIISLFKAESSPTVVPLSALVLASLCSSQHWHPPVITIVHDRQLPVDTPVAALAYPERALILDCHCLSFRLPHSPHSITLNAPLSFTVSVCSRRFLFGLALAALAYLGVTLVLTSFRSIFHSPHSPHSTTSNAPLPTTTSICSRQFSFDNLTRRTHLPRTRPCHSQELLVLAGFHLILHSPRPPTPSVSLPITAYDTNHGI